MLKKTISYKDFNGVDRTEDFYFNVTDAELTRMALLETETDGEGNVIKNDLKDRLERISKSNKGSEILPEFEEIIRLSIGVKSEDGRFFRKSKEISDDFINSAAWPVLFMEFLTNASYAAEFVNKVVQIDGPVGNANDTAELARRRSEAALQGHKAPAERPLQTVGSGLTQTEDVNGNSLFKPPAAPPLTDAERGELEELRALKAAQSANREFQQPAQQDFVQRPAHESGPGFQQD